MGRFHVRNAQPKDAVAVVRIANQAFLETARLTSCIGKGFAQALMNHNDWLFVAEDEDKRVIGFLIGQRVEEKAKINWIAVHPDYWRRGVGGLLLRAIEKKARREGLRIIETGTPFARGFYEKYGFKCVEAQRRLILELIGRNIKPPENIQICPLLLDDVSSLVNIMNQDEYLRFLISYFTIFSSDPRKALLGLDGDKAVGVALDTPIPYIETWPYWIISIRRSQSTP